MFSLGETVIWANRMSTMETSQKTTASRPRSWRMAGTQLKTKWRWLNQQFSFVIRFEAFIYIYYRNSFGCRHCGRLLITASSYWLLTPSFMLTRRIHSFALRIINAFSGKLLCLSSKCKARTVSKRSRCPPSVSFSPFSTVSVIE